MPRPLSRRYLVGRTFLEGPKWSVTFLLTCRLLIRQSSAAPRRWPESSRRAAAASQLSARRPHASRSSLARSPHGRHGERGQLLRASGFAPCWEVFTWMVTVREGAHQCGRAVGTDDSIRVVRHRKDTNRRLRSRALGALATSPTFIRGRTSSMARCGLVAPSPEVRAHR